jgi:DMSO/TMAO reductase YedYZ molybdopterin-dependent catalytic subunit
MNSKLLFLAAIPCLIAPAHADAVLRIHDGKEWKELDQAAWDKLPRAEVIGKARDGTEKRFSGVPMVEILKFAGAPLGDALRGGEMNRVVLFTAADNYQTVYSLAELDPSFGKQNIILADQVDGKPLDEFEGSRMVVAGDDLRHSRWIRQVKQIILTRATPPAP